MATPLSASKLLAVLRAEGCRVSEYRSWRAHNRNHMGSWGPVYGVMIHHTVTSDVEGTLRLVYYGRSDLPGPLAHTVAAKDGRLYMTGHGRANHAGSGDDDVLRAVINESYGSAPPSPNERNTDGNARFYGIECINLGSGRDPWPEKQVDAMARWAAGICRAHGWSAKSVIGHKEWTNQKIDPRPSPGGADVSMPAFRARVKALLANKPGADVPIITPPKEDPVPSKLNRTDQTDRTRTPGEWKTLSINGADLVEGSECYDVLVQLTLKAPAGSTLQGRFYHERPDGKRENGTIIERTATSGSSFLDFPAVGGIDKAEKLRFELLYHPVDSSDTKQITISSGRVRGLYWKA